MARRRKDDKKDTSTKETNRASGKGKEGKGKNRERFSLAAYLRTEQNGYKFTAILIAIVVSYFHGRHLSILFENDRFFSHLSGLERQMSFRTEMGLYYSYYKTMIDAPSIGVGLSSIVYDNVTEYPSTINVLKRFNLYPELMLGVGFRSYAGFLSAFKRTGKQCYSINRGKGLSPVASCEGMGDEMYFYINPIFFLNGVFMGVVFLLTAYLGGGIFGGLIAVAGFFFNHSEATRVQWTPPLRESFAVPFLFMQLLAVTHVIRSNRPTQRQCILVTVLTVCFMLPWQFAQFALFTQTLSLFGCYVLHFLPTQKLKLLVIAQTIALGVNFVLQFGNPMLLTSFYAACLLSVWILLYSEKALLKLKVWPVIACVQVALLIGLTVASKHLVAKAFNIADDAHISDILRAKFTDFKNFHTLLYTCAAEFDFLGWENPTKLSYTLALPAACIVLFTIFVRVAIAVFRELFYEDQSKKSDDDENEESTKLGAEFLYHFLQNLAFLGMAVLIMRLKLFYTPHVCILAGLLGSEKLFGVIRGNHRLLLLFLLFGGMAFNGYRNVQQQLSTQGEFSDVEQEEMVEWVRNNTAKDAVFAGSMPGMAGIKLNTQRLIVMHPHYEDVGVRERTKKVYQLYSGKPSEQIHATLRQMGVQYVLMESRQCQRGPRDGCSMKEIWDVEDVGNRGKPPFCSLVFQGKVPVQFKKLFQNPSYLILKLA